MDRGITVAEVTYCNSIRFPACGDDDPGIGAQRHSFLPVVVNKGWNIADLRRHPTMWKDGKSVTGCRAHRHCCAAASSPST